MKYLFIIINILMLSCTKETTNKKYHAVVVGKLRSWGGGIGLSMSDNIFSNVSYKGYNHVVEALNIPIGLPENTIIEFKARKATESEKIYIKSADGFEGSPIIYITDYTIKVDSSDVSDVPSCINDKIQQYIAKGDTAEVTQVRQYYYNQKIYYLFIGACCDAFNFLVDENCNTICAPSGGISGGGNDTCPDFSKNSYFIRNVWTK